MKRVAIPVVNGKLYKYSRQCRYFEIFRIDENGIINNKVKELYDINEKKIQEWAVEKKITDVIVYKMDRAVIDLFVKNKINVYIGVPIETPKFLIDEYLNGRLESDESVLNNEINE